MRECPPTDALRVAGKQAHVIRISRRQQHAAAVQGSQLDGQGVNTLQKKFRTILIESRALLDGLFFPSNSFENQLMWTQNFDA